MYEYACEFILRVQRGHKIYPYDASEVFLVSEHPELWDFIEFDSDFYFDDPRFKELEDGEYIIYARGKAEFESDRDWESGIEEGHFLLGIDYLKITNMPEIT